MDRAIACSCPSPYTVAQRDPNCRWRLTQSRHHGSNSSTTEAFLQEVRPAHVVITAGNQGFGGTMLPRPETFLRIQNVSNQLNLNTQVWRTDRDDKTPTVVPVGSETGDDTILATSWWPDPEHQLRGCGDDNPGTRSHSVPGNYADRYTMQA